VWRASGEIRHCWAAVAEAVEAADPERRLSHLTVRLNELLLLVLEMLRSQNPRLDLELTSSHRTVKLFLDELSAHPGYLVEEWTLARMAESCGLGITQFVQVVKQLVNATPFDYLNHQRLEYAARLLRANPKEPITDIAQACGFSTSQYFGTVFRRRFGCTPSKFRSATACSS
jgi:AraC family L-rhamnose operon regulatory protein RhaS